VFYGYWVPRIALRYAARVWLDDSQDITEDDFGGRRMGMVLWPQIANRPRGHPLNPRRPIWNHLKHTNQAKVENTITIVLGHTINLHAKKSNAPSHIEKSEIGT